jgi:signal transduction histidine kinase
MNSIRKKLTLGLLLGFSLLLLASGVTEYYSLRRALAGQWDATLRSQAFTLMAGIREEANKTEVEFAPRGPAENQTNAPIEYYQVFRINGPIVRRSASLDGTDLPREFGPMKAPVFFDVTLPDGQIGRAAGVRFFPKPEAPHRNNNNNRRRATAGGTNAVAASVSPEATGRHEVGLVVASRRESMQQALADYLNSELIAGGLLLAATVLLVAFALRQGLRPLEQLAQQARGIDAKSLKERFPTANLPTELVPITGRLNELLARLERAFVDLSEHAAKVSHELRTPLTIVRLKLEHAGGNVSPELAEEIQDELHQLSQYVDLALLIAKAEQGRLVAEPCVFDLAGSVQDVASDFSLLAAEVGRRVTTALQFPTYVEADPRNTRQILRNLLNNAFKHGVGEIRTHLRVRGARVTLWIGNRLAPQPSTADSTRIGVKVVQTLLALQPSLRYRCRPGHKYYATTISFPARSSVGVASQPAVEYPGLRIVAEPQAQAVGAK